MGRHGWAQFGTPMFDRALQMGGFDYLRQTHGDEYTAQLIQRGARDPQYWLSQMMGRRPLPMGGL